MGVSLYPLYAAPCPRRGSAGERNFCSVGLPVTLIQGARFKQRVGFIGVCGWAAPGTGEPPGHRLASASRRISARWLRP